MPARTIKKPSPRNVVLPTTCLSMPLYDYGANNYGLANGSSRKRNATWRRYWLCVRARLRPRRPRCSTTLTMSSAPVRRGCSTASGFKGAIRQDLGAYAREPSIQFIGSLQPSFVDPKTGAQHCRTARCIIVWFLASRRVDGACISLERQTPPNLF
jgi:hypothetical protein